MGIIHQGKYIKTSEEDILIKKWKFSTVTGDTEPSLPSLCIFYNIVKAIKLLNKHVENNNSIGFHSDVDVDGIGTTYILKRFLLNQGSNKHLLLINKDKIHGIQMKHVEYFKKRPIDLLIITDSSCNEIDIIKQFNCDVLVIDHHELLHRDLSGKCNDGIHEYVIVNNTIDNFNFEEDEMWLSKKNNTAFNNIEMYKGTNDMSCGLEVYELLRIYSICFANEKVLENLLLFQWVGITLFTDAINTLNDRNQWYMSKTVHNSDTEATLRTLMSSITRYKASLDKSYINYTFAPLINKAIRAGESAKALSLVINNPSKIMELDVYKELQQEAIEKSIYVTTNNNGIQTKCEKAFNKPYILMDISALNINPNYTGVIASKLGGEHNKNSAIYVVLEDGLCKGSFRGRYQNIDYRKYFAEFSEDIYAQGHPTAFGFKLKFEQLEYLMQTLQSIEPSEEIKPYITIGNIPDKEHYGVYHVESLDEFKRQGYIWRLAIGNSKVASKDEIYLKVHCNDISLKEIKGKLYLYDVLGVECKAFKALQGEYFNVYVEFTNEVNFYIR